MRLQEAADQGLVLLYRHASLLLANLSPSFGWATTSMMPSGGTRCIDRRLMYERACKVHPRKFVTAILHKPRPMGSWGGVAENQFTTCGGGGSEEMAA